jgi:Helix-turn-helix domain
MTRKCLTLPALPPLWETPAPYRELSNGGPPLEPRSAGRPTISTPELRGRILDLLLEGMPMRAICRVAGLPSRSTVYGWRRGDPEFDRQVEFMAQEGRFHLISLVGEEFERMLQEHPPRVARRVFNIRRRQCVRVNPRYFGGG